MRGNWLGSILNKKYSDKGFLDAKGAISEFDSYEPEIRNLMFEGAANYSKFKVMLQQLEKIPTKDFLGRGSDVNALQTAVGYFIKGPLGKAVSAANTAKKALADVLMENAKVAEYMKDEGFLNLASTASTPEEKMTIAKFADQFNSIISNSKKVGDKYIPNNLVTSAFNSQIQHSNEGTDRADDTWNKMSDEAKTTTPRQLQNPLTADRKKKLKNPLGP